MNPACDNTLAESANGVAAALRAVDCVASDMTGAAFGRLFAPGGALGPALTIMLALFIALFAVGLLLGRTSLSIRSVVPRMITLGLVLTFATSWFAYQSVVWNLAVATPDYLATVLTGSDGSATATFADKIDIVFAAVQQASPTTANGGDAAISAFSPAGMMWLGAMLLLLGTVGVLVTARIALALLVALGPIFVVMALFNGTRGLFTGWLKGLVMLALTPLFAVLGGSVMLELSVPVLASLTRFPGQLDARAAMAFFTIGAVHVALMIMVLKVAATMVSGWRVFGLLPIGEKDRQISAGGLSPAVRPSAATYSAAAGSVGSAAPSRQIPITGVIAAVPANDAGSGAAVTRRETHVYATSGGSGQAQPLAPAASRTRGIGSRFRAPAAKPAKAPLTEKLK